LGPPDGAAHHHLDALDPRRVDGEDALDAHAVRRLPHGEHLTARPARTSEHRALEDLDAFLVPLDHPDVHPNGVAGSEGRNVLATLPRLDTVDRVHGTAQS